MSKAMSLIKQVSVLVMLSLAFAGCDGNGSEQGEEPGQAEPGTPSPGNPQGHGQNNPPNGGDPGEQNPGDNPNNPNPNSGSHGLIEGGEEPEEPNPNEPGPISTALSITRVTPASGSVAGGEEVRVWGTGFGEDAAVSFGLLPSPSVQYNSSVRVRAVVPPGRYGCVDVRVTSGGKTVSLPSGYCYTENMAIQAIAPTRVATGTDTAFEITGEGFHAPLSITFDGAEVQEFQILSDSKISGIFPQHPAGTANLRIVNAQNRAVLTDAVVYVDKPAIESIAPAAIPVGKITRITLSGHSLDMTSKIMVGEAFARIIDTTENAVVAEAPNLSAGFKDIVLMSTAGQQRLENAVQYYDPSLNNRIFSISPNWGFTSGKTPVRVDGENLSGTGALKLGSAKAEVSSRNADYILAETGASSAGTVDVALEGATTLSGGFTYVEPIQISSVVPNSGSQAGGTSVTLSGEHFPENPAVRVGSMEAQSVQRLDDKTLRLVTPPGSGLAAISVSDGRQSVVAAEPFRYEAALSVLGISPKESPITGGAVISVMGTGFSPDTVLLMDGKPIENVKYVDSNLMEFVSGAHAEGEVSLSVQREETTSSSPDLLNYYNPGGLYTSAGGGNVAGTLNVTVLTVGKSEPIANAKVQIGTDAGTALTGYTNEAGMITFHDATLAGPQYVFACAEDYTCTSLQPVNAKNVILYLEYLKEADIDINIDIEDIEDIEFDPNEINPINYKEEETGEIVTYISGKVTGLDKIELESDPDTVKAAFVIQSQLGTYVNTSTQEDEVRYVFENNGTYQLRSRKGEVAMAVYCGMYNQKTKAFDPRYMGVKRFIVVSEGVDQKVDLSCTLPLNQTQSIKLLDAPLHSGPNVVQSQAYIFLGNEGYIGGFMKGTSENDLVVVTKIPPLRDSLEGASLAFVTGVYTNYGAPYSTIYEYNYFPDGSTLEQGPITATPIFVTPDTENILETGHLAWSVEKQENVDYYSILIRQVANYNYQDLWQFYLPGSATSLDFPPMTLDLEPYSTFSIFVSISAYTSAFKGYDFNYFSTMDLRSAYLKSSGYNYMYIKLKPVPQK